MDLIDNKIIELLCENARINFSEVGEQVGLSVSAAIERIKKLENSGVIKKYTAILDNEAFGKEVVAIVTVRLDHPKYTKDFIAAALENKDVLECHYVAGDYDYLLKVVTHSPKTLEKLIQKIKSFNGVTRTNTTIVLSTLKCEYSFL